jgi:hypothetical protein
MYIPGRFRTGSSPSNTVIWSTPYALCAALLAAHRTVLLPVAAVLSGILAVVILAAVVVAALVAQREDGSDDGDATNPCTPAPASAQLRASQTANIIDIALFGISRAVYLLQYIGSRANPTALQRHCRL